MSQLVLNKVASPSTPAAGKASVYYSSTLSPAALAAIDESGNIMRLGGFTTKDYRVVRTVNLYNGTTSYTPTSGVTAVSIFAVGGGGAGGGAGAGVAATSFGIGSGGGGGGAATAFLAANLGGACVVAIGAGGVAGTAGANAGGNGGNTTFTDTGATLRLQASGGTGGTGSATSATLGGHAAGGAGGAASGTPVEGVTGTTFQGEDGHWSMVWAPTLAATGALSGRGGASVYGSGGASIQTSGPGAAGRKYGGGGSGGIDSAATARQGGAGAVGIMLVTEYA